MPEFVDTHCHLQFEAYKDTVKREYDEALSSGVTKMITIGTDADDSHKALMLAGNYEKVWASVGLHPHEAKYLKTNQDLLRKLAKQPKVVAIGECGLDYFYNHSPKDDQVRALRFQIELALELQLPLVFHVRDAYDDFWPVFDDYQGLTGVFHCFAATPEVLENVLKRNLYVGLNGITTFSKNPEQMAAFKAVPLNKLLLETDAPYLTPAPLRGKINDIKNIVIVAEFLGKFRGESLEELAIATTNNVSLLFGV